MQQETLYLAFVIGQTVFIKNDKDQCELIVTGYTVRPNGLITYILSDLGHETSFYDFELTDEKDTLKSIS
jgi:hypothetical protein